MERVRSYVTGMLLSFITWEAWESMLLSVVVATVGGFAAAAGRQLHQRLYEWRNIKRKKDEQEDTTNQ